MAEQHSCPSCGQSFGSRREADDHMEKVHGGGAKKGGETEREAPPDESKRPT